MIIPKVYSPKRSGTHFLMASIYYNFELPDVSSKMVMRKSWNGQEATDKEVLVPWALLFGDHQSLPSEGIFIYRHPLDTFYSHWVFCGKFPPLIQWLEEKNIRYWKDLVSRAFELPLLKIRYEDLVNDFQNTMKRIQDYYDLKPKQTPFISVKKGVGWDANMSGGHNHRDKYDQEAFDRIKKVLGDEIFGYKISKEN